MAKFRLHKPTLKLLDGLSGIELGAGAHNPFGVDAINVAPNRPEDEVFRQAEIAMCGESAKVDLVGHAADIPVPDGSVDFVVSSHVLEHAPDLFRAFLEMDRVVRPGGYVVIIFPLPNALREDTRPCSSFNDAVTAYLDAWTWESYPAKDIPGGVGGHYWKFPCDQFKAMVKLLYRKRKAWDWPGLKWTLWGEEDPDTKVGNGFWLAYRVKG